VPNTPALTSPSSRFLFIDLLRGWAVFIMIETHVVNALLQVPLKERPTFAVLTFINGLVAPSFLFCAGFASAITLHCNWKAFVGLTRTLWRYILRVLFILIVGYSLHFPYFSLSRMASLHDEIAWISFLQVDILQTIAVMVLQFLVRT
jgi:uncharacterized membrane protein